MITEFPNDPNNSIELEYRYYTDSVYELKVVKNEDSWCFQLKLTPLAIPVEKRFKSTLFEATVEHPRCFKYSLNGRSAGYLQIGHQTWNNRIRIWDFLVDEDFRRSGIATKLMDLAKVEAQKAGARMLVLETQSCNVPAIKFYLKNGFQLIGFDLAHYSNNDVNRNEFRVEFGFELPQ